MRWRQKLLQTSCIQIRVSEPIVVYAVSIYEGKQSLADTQQQSAAKQVCWTLTVTSLDNCPVPSGIGMYYGNFFEHKQTQSEIKRNRSALHRSRTFQEAQGVHTGGFCNYTLKWAHLPRLKSPHLPHVIASTKEVLITVFYNNISVVMQISKYRYVKIAKTLIPLECLIFIIGNVCTLIE